MFTKNEKNKTNTEYLNYQAKKMKSGQKIK
jgi:hypothetical protein